MQSLHVQEDDSTLSVPITQHFYQGELVLINLAMLISSDIKQILDDQIGGFIWTSIYRPVPCTQMKICIRIRNHIASI